MSWARSATIPGRSRPTAVKMNHFLTSGIVAGTGARGRGASPATQIGARLQIGFSAAEPGLRWLDRPAPVQPEAASAAWTGGSGGSCARPWRERAHALQPRAVARASCPGLGVPGSDTPPLACARFRPGLSLVRGQSSARVRSATVARHLPQRRLVELLEGQFDRTGCSRSPGPRSCTDGQRGRSDHPRRCRSRRCIGWGD